MHVLLLGSGGREHTLAWKLSSSPRCTRLFIAPGNAGTALCGTNVALAADDFEGIDRLVQSEQIGLIVVGPEDPLVKGVYDYFDGREDVFVVGPSAAAARLEGSKDFAKAFMAEYGIPTADYRSFTRKQLEEARAFLAAVPGPYVLKADGLAAGKGVVICDDLDTANSELEEMLDGRFGAASETVVIERFLKGREFSVFVLTDGEAWKLLPVAKDYKRVGEGDTGPNTGGMGAVSPVSFAGEALMQKVRERIIEPTVRGIGARDMTYKGFIFFGLIEVEGEPYVIEYNVRLGDPETEVVIPRLENDLLELFLLLRDGRLSEAVIRETPEAACAVMLCSEGYPGDYSRGHGITSPGSAEDTYLFHAGTLLVADTGQVVTNGGRVMAVTSLARSVEAARESALNTVDKVAFANKYYRKDIGFDVR